MWKELEVPLWPFTPLESGSSHKTLPVALLTKKLWKNTSVEECARYLETLKTYENKPADSIQERTDNDYLSRVSMLYCPSG